MHNALNEQPRIPKIIHYCWFGRKPKPDVVLACMDMWRRTMPDYRIVEWNEDNYDVSSHPYAAEAYAAGKFAFVSDVVRIHALYREGGIYLDTDVEVYRRFDPLLDSPSFWGFEYGDYIATSTIGAAPGNPLIRMFLDAYEGRSFRKPDGAIDDYTNVALVTGLLKERGVRMDGTYQELSGEGVFYPQTYFSPYDYANCRYLKDADTYAMHLFHKSWVPLHRRLRSQCKTLVARAIGGHNLYKLRKAFAPGGSKR